MLESAIILRQEWIALGHGGTGSRGAHQAATALLRHLVQGSPVQLNELIGEKAT
ncbi:hypothetical protein SAMN05192543_11715 [Paraburkholderia megapolitana]|uniref:Uncharacterized protein n=1 Tax=Paraburkholderia megapolitana TaxID=420953 RepID=A0A1I3W8Z9_9BURK|nr:hypothetical protein SAMN05192543_11715 [Paraburkholderia megapolitana]